METLTISARTRELKKKKTRELKRNGYIPAVVYGPKSENRSIEVEGKDFLKIFDKAGESTLIDLKIDGKDIGKVIINDYQSDPVSDNIIHVDLYQVRMDRKITAKVPLKFAGESPAVKNEGGVLVKNHDKLEIECLPGDLLNSIEIDLSVLGKIDDAIRIKDLKISDKVKITADPEEIIVNVIPQRSEKELEELEGKVEENIEGIEVIKEKKEEAVPEEGESPDAKKPEKKEEKKK